MNASILDTWITKDVDLWRRVTREHEFLDAVRNGSVDSGVFATWFVQDYIFVRKFATFAGHVLACAPLDRRAEISSDPLRCALAAVAALDNELSWFEQSAAIVEVSEEHLLRSARALAATEVYCGYLAELESAEKSPAVLFTVLFAIESVYFHAWRSTQPAAVPHLAPILERWSSDAFGAYCDRLKRVASQLLMHANSSETQRARSAFRAVLELELKFWDMASSGGGASFE